MASELQYTATVANGKWERKAGEAFHPLRNLRSMEVWNPICIDHHPPIRHDEGAAFSGGKRLSGSSPRPYSGY